LPLRSFALVAGKEWRELLASRAYWLLLLIIGPLTGHAFLTAVATYSEMSAGALAQGLSPLDGLLAPTFGAYDLAVTLLFPFVAIRLISSEKENGAWKLMRQSPPGLGWQLAAKGLVLAAGWAVAWLPALAALLLWRLYGGWLFAPETLNLIAGHVLRMMLAASVAVAAAAIANNAATAAIAALGFTVGTWALDFVAAGRGGWLEQAAAYTPAAALRSFEHGLLSTSTVVVTVALAVCGFVLAAVWLPARRRSATVWMTAATLSIAALACAAGSTSRTSWDCSENRRNSFTSAEETALRRIVRPLAVTVVLAPEDPRLSDLDRNVLSKLKRVLPQVNVEYSAHSRTGLFEAGDHYGEIWYQMDGRRVMSRSTTEPIVIETVLSLAGVAQPGAGKDAPYAGHPLTTEPVGAAWLYYLAWPAIVLLGWWGHETTAAVGFERGASD
jgi:ABC-2 type transport system permease protein